MSKGQDYYREQIIEASPVEVYAATNTAMMEYPYTLGRPNEKSPTLAEQSEKYIMDSGIGDDSFSTSDVITAADDVGADYVVAKDVLGQPSETTDGIIDMLCENPSQDVIIPLQSSQSMTHYDHYCELKDTLLDYGFSITDYRVAIGGIKDLSVEEQILRVLEFQWKAGLVDAHAFGCGIHSDWVVALRRCPKLLTSIDSSSVRAYVNNGSAFDGMMNTRTHEMPRGRNSTVLTTMLRETMLYTYNYLLTDYVRETDVPTEFSSDELREKFNTFM